MKTRMIGLAFTSWLLTPRDRPPLVLAKRHRIKPTVTLPKRLCPFRLQRRSTAYSESGGYWSRFTCCFWSEAILLCFFFGQESHYWPLFTSTLNYNQRKSRHIRRSSIPPNCTHYHDAPAMWSLGTIVTHLRMVSSRLDCTQLRKGRFDPPRTEAPGSDHPGSGLHHGGGLSPSRPFRILRRLVSPPKAGDVGLTGERGRQPCRR
jgi:hypothetical protein